MKTSMNLKNEGDKVIKEAWGYEVDMMMIWYTPTPSTKNLEYPE